MSIDIFGSGFDPSFNPQERLQQFRRVLAGPRDAWLWEQVPIDGKPEPADDLPIIALLALYLDGSDDGKLAYAKLFKGYPITEQELQRHVASCVPSLAAFAKWWDTQAALENLGEMVADPITDQLQAERVLRAAQVEFAMTGLPAAAVLLLRDGEGRERTVFLGSKEISAYYLWQMLRAGAEFASGTS